MSLSFLMKRAEYTYRQAMKDFRIAMNEAEKRFDQDLRDPEKNESLGLPRELPEETIRILRRTQAIDKIGPTLPKRKDFYKKYGIIIDKEAAT